MTDSLPISACVITLNEEENIGRCLKSVQWADEILVVDSGSEDRTVKIARECGARVIHNDWPGHKQQKQYATDHAHNDWIFSLDADEEVSNPLQNSIEKLFQNSSPNPEITFKVNRLCYFLGRWIYHGSWHPDWIFRLFNRTTTKWGGTNPHDRVLPTNKTAKLDGKLYHYPYENISENVDFGNYYSDIQSKNLLEEKRGMMYGTAILHGGFKFLKDYILKRGFLDGTPGLYISVIGAFNTFLKYAKLWERKNLDEDDDLSYPR